MKQKTIISRYALVCIGDNYNIYNNYIYIYIYIHKKLLFLEYKIFYYIFISMTFS